MNCQVCERNIEVGENYWRMSLSKKLSEDTFGDQGQGLDVCETCKDKLFNSRTEMLRLENHFKDIVPSLVATNDTLPDFLIRELNWRVQQVQEQKGSLERKHSIFTRCWNCNTWGISMPGSDTCGDCGSKDITQYWPLE